MNEEAVKKTEKRRSGLKIALLVLAVLLVLLLAASLLFPKTFNFDRVVRFFRYMGLRDDEKYGKVSFEVGASNRYAAFDDGLLVVSEGGLTLYDLEGGQKAFLQTTLPTPILSAGESLCVCFSPGSGSFAAVGTGGEIVLDETLSGTIIDADVSEDGYLAYVAAESGYKAVVTVLNRNQEAMFRFTARSKYLNSCAISPEGTYLALATLGEKNGQFESGVTILRTDTEVEDLSAEDSAALQTSFGSRVIYDLKFIDETHLLAVTESDLCFLDTKGAVLQTVPLEGETLLSYDVSGKGFVSLVLQRTGAGGQTRLLSLSETGETLGSLTVTERFCGLSAEDSYIALLTEKSLYIYDKKLKQFFRADNLYDATGVLAREDGTALLLGRGTAYLYIP